MVTQEQIAALVKRLRGAGKHPMMDGNCKVDVYVVHEAADMLEQLAAERAKNEWVLIKYDNGDTVHLSSFSGGAAPEGIMGTLTLMKEDAEGNLTFREYRAVSRWHAGPQEFAALEPATDARTYADGVRDAAKVVEPKRKRPCDCDSCYCGNPGDAAEVAEWDADNHNAAAIRALLTEKPHD